MKKKIVMMLVLTFTCGMLLTGCGTNDRNSDEVTTQEQNNAGGMVHLENADEVSAFFDEVYANVAQDMLPANIATTELDLTDMDTVTYQTGLTDISGIEGIYLSESMMSSVAYSAVYIRTNDEADAAQIKQSIFDNVNPAKWICVMAEKQISANFGDDVFYVMASADTADQVYEQAKLAAESRGMTVASDVLEKTNAQ